MNKKINEARKYSLATRAIHGKRIGAFNAPLILPIHQTSTFRFDTSEHLIRWANGDNSEYVYTRYNNPSTEEVEQRLALINGTESSALFASGMASIATTIFALTKSNEEIVSSPSLYGATYRFFRDELPKWNLSVKFFESQNLDSLEKVITPKTSIIYFETPTNPTLEIIDINELVVQVRKIEQAVKKKILIVIDNTFSTIINQNPFDFGVDIVVESATKYIGGHSDLLAGIVTGSLQNIQTIKKSANYIGGCADPFMAFLLARSLKTLELRVERQNQNAIRLAQELEKHPKISRVIYPGLPSHPQHTIAKKQMKGFGGMITIEIKPQKSMNSLDAAILVTEKLQIVANAPSLGGVETLVSIPVISSHINMNDPELARHQVTQGMIRISLGIEGIDDIINDFNQALEYI
jgi:cystathionine beta-lyase/cystathionine gamma-synthase